MHLRPTRCNRTCKDNSLAAHEAQPIYQEHRRIMHYAHAALLRPLEQKMPTYLPTIRPTNLPSHTWAHTPITSHTFHLTPLLLPPFTPSRIPAMSPQTTTASAHKCVEPTTSPAPAALTKHGIPAHQAKYLVKKTELEEFLQKTFGAGLNFNISVSERKKKKKKRMAQNQAPNAQTPKKPHTP